MLNLIRAVLNRTSGRSQTWTTSQFVNLGNSLGIAFGAGMNRAKSKSEANAWTSEKLVQMGESLSHIHPGL
jgi:hypothetical protein